VALTPWAFLCHGLHNTLWFKTVKCQQLAVGAFFGAESAFFGILLFLVRLTPTIPNLVEFFGEKRGGVSYWDISG
jgi:hypothetical protein